jgi:flagellar hook-length control protein FliK
MNTSNLDALLKGAPQATKAAPTNAPREEAEQFGSYLRDAAEANRVNSEKPAAKAPVAIGKPAEEQPVVTTAGEEQGFTATTDQETVATEVAEQVAVTTEDEVNHAISDEANTDEVILSVAATALVEPEVVVVPVEVTVELPVESAPVAEAKFEVPTEPATLGQDFVPQLEAPTKTGEEPLHIVELVNTTTTDGGKENENAEKMIAIESDLLTTESTELSKNSGLTASTGPPKPTAAPKASKPIIPASMTETGSDNKTAAATSETENDQETVVATTGTGSDKERTAAPDSETVKVDATEENVEAVTKIVDGALVTTDRIADETKVESPGPAPATPTAIGGTQNQQSIQPLASHAEAPLPQADGESPMPTIDRARFVQRVANAFRSAQQNDGQIQMRLSPPELGSLKIEIAVRNGVLSANLEAETPDARRVLLDNLPALRQRLAEQDIRIDKFEVDIRREGGEQQGQAEAQQQQTEQQSQRASARNRIRTTQASEVIATRVSRSVTTNDNSGLDVRV